MKFSAHTVIAPTLLFPIISASWSSIKSQLTNLTRLNRALPPTDMKMLDQYGCWCYFTTDHGRGKGEPADKVDQQCKILHDGYECAIKDGDDLSQACVPWEVSYNSATGFGMGANDIDNLRTECEDRNAVDSCEARACMVEGYFVVQVMDLFVSGHFADPLKQHSLGFDPMTECHQKGPGTSSEHKCCGIYPLRYPFKTYDGLKNCCGQVTYNVDLMECCDDNVPRFSC